MNFIELDNDRMINLNQVVLIKRDKDKRKIHFYDTGDGEIVVDFDNVRQLNEFYETLRKEKGEC